jgi:hypothetical protein
MRLRRAIPRTLIHGTILDRRLKPFGCSMLDVKDAEGLAVPLAMFPSEGEPADIVRFRVGDNLIENV